MTKIIHMKIVYTVVVCTHTYICRYCKNEILLIELHVRVIEIFADENKGITN